MTDRVKAWAAGLALAAVFIAWGLLMPDVTVQPDSRGQCVKVTTYFAIFTTVEPCQP